jgi:hypothetical protein
LNRIISYSAGFLGVFIFGVRQFNDESTNFMFDVTVVGVSAVVVFLAIFLTSKNLE